MNAKKDKRFPLMLTEAQREWLTDRSLAETARLQTHITRAEVIRRWIDRSMAREARKK